MFCSDYSFAPSQSGSFVGSPVWTRAFRKSLFGPSDARDGTMGHGRAESLGTNLRYEIPR